MVPVPTKTEMLTLPHFTGQRTRIQKVVRLGVNIYRGSVSINLYQSEIRPLLPLQIQCIKIKTFWVCKTDHNYKYLNSLILNPALLGKLIIERAPVYVGIARRYIFYFWDHPNTNLVLF